MKIIKKNTSVLKHFFIIFYYIMLLKKPKQKREKKLTASLLKEIYTYNKGGKKLNKVETSSICINE